MGGKAPTQAGTIDTTQRTRNRTNNRASASTAVDIPTFLQPFLSGNVRNAQQAQADFASAGRGDLVADFTPDQTAAFDMARGFATSDPFQSALNAFQTTANGDYLYGGPGQQAFVDAAVRSAQPGVISRFGGRGGSGLAAASIGQAAVDASAGLFNAERDRQLQAAAGLPSLAMTPIDLLLQTGGAQQTQAQNQINAPLAFAQDRYNMAMGGLPISSLLGSTSTSSGFTSSRGNTVQQQPYFENEGADLLGTVLSGVGLASGLGGALFGPARMAKVFGEGGTGLLGMF